MSRNTVRGARAVELGARAIELQVMWNRLAAVVEEQAQALIRTAFSPIVRECGDISAGIFDIRGRMLAQAVTGTPGHVITMAEGAKHFLEAFPVSTMRPGDIYATNDPWLATGHLNDILLLKPVFRRDGLIGLVSCTSHLYDLGGVGMGPDGSDVFDEGLLIPMVKLVDRGSINDLLLDIVKANSRAPISNEGDLYALISCCEVGAERLVEMMEEFSIDRLDELAEYICETSNRATLEAIAAVPAGVYSNSMRVDGYESEIELRVALTVTADSMVADFSGSSPCSDKGVNVPINYTAAYTSFGLRCLVGRGIPNNAGSLAPFRTTASESTILSAPRPAPVAMRHIFGHLVSDLVMGCLDDAIPGLVPAESCSVMWDIPLRNGSVVMPGEKRTAFAIELTHHGGMGARPDKDGLSVTAFPSGVWGSQVEVTETVAPVRIVRRELRPDTGGPGRFRGGLGQVIELESAENAPISFFGAVDRIEHPARGRHGGLAGACGRITLSSGLELSGKGKQMIPAGERLVFETPGGGGYGNPRERDLERVVADVRAGLVSREAALTVYGAEL
jgi:N-methylhydantoinase B